jgi:hypothetical protein
MNVKLTFVREAALAAVFVMALAQASRGQASAAPAEPPRHDRIESGSLLSVEVFEGKPWKHVRDNSVLEGSLELPLFSGETTVVPAGTRVRLAIESVRKEHERASLWRRTGRILAAAFNPLEKPRVPTYQVRLRDVEIVSPDGHGVGCRVSVLRAGWSIPVAAGGKTPKGTNSVLSAKENKPHQTLLLRLDEEVVWPTADLSSRERGSNTSSQPASLDESKARAFLLSDLSASHSRESDRFQAQLAEPVRLPVTTFGPGSLIEGTVLRSKAPRILSRTGSLYLRVDRILAKDGRAVAANGTLDSAEADARARFVLNEEGQLRGRKPGLTRGLVDLAMAYAVGKVTDDIAETPIRAIGAAMSDAAVANAARYFGLGASAAFLITRHGRDVHLAKYSEIEVDFGRVTPQVVGSLAAKTPSSAQ